MPLHEHIQRLETIVNELDLADHGKAKVLDFMRQAPGMCFIKDAETGKYVYANPAFLMALGKREEEVLGKTDGDLFSTDIAAALVKQDMRVLKADGAHAISVEKIPGVKDNCVYLVSKFIILNGSRWIGGLALEVPAELAVTKNP